MSNRLWLSIVLLSFFVWGCNNGPKYFIYFVNTDVSPILIVSGNSTSISLSWEVDFCSEDGDYQLSIYLSRDQTIDDEDILIYNDKLSSKQGNFIINSDSLSVTPGKFYFIFKASVEKSIQDLQTKSFTIQSPEKNWTIMVYMSGDQLYYYSLSNALNNDLKEMIKVGSSNEVNILALADTDSSTASLYYIKLEELEKLADMGEVDMAAEETLVNFAKWVLDVFPAKYYLLILWNHGGGFKKTKTFVKDLLWDDHPVAGHWMDIPTLASALDNITSYLGRSLDIVGFDACLMNMVEIAYEIKDKGLFMVGSENIEDEDGWPYDLFLSWLVENPTATPHDLAQKIVEFYISYYTYSSSAILGMTLSAINLSYLDNVVQNLNILSEKLIDAISQNSTIGEILSNQISKDVQRFDDGCELGISLDDDSFADLYHLAELISESLPEFSSEAQDLEESLNSTIIAQGSIGELVKDAHGLSIWFPDPDSYIPPCWDYYWDHYSKLRFFTNSTWPELITTLREKE